MKPRWSDAERSDPLSPLGPAPASETPAPLPQGMESPAEGSMIGLLRELVEAGGSDLHVTAGLPPRLRLDGELVNSRLSPRALRPEATLALAWSLLSDRQRTAFEAANAVEYGLAASVYTRDVQSIFHFVDRVDVGIAHVNQPTLGGEVHLPFGGVKSSGMGPHEQGRDAIDFFTKVKTVYINHG